MKTNTKNMEIYVGTYSKYNDGNLEGSWIDVKDLTEDDFCNKITNLHTDEEDPEFMFQDIDIDIQCLKDLVSESGIDKEFWDLKEQINRLSDTEIEAFDIFVSNGHPANVNTFRDAYRGFTDSWNIYNDFGMEIAEECGYIDQMPEPIKYYFDAEGFGRDLLNSDFWEEDGHIFYSNY
jgi:antirestriction protein